MSKIFAANQSKPLPEPRAPLNAPARAPSPIHPPAVTAPPSSKLFDNVQPDHEQARAFFAALFPPDALIHFRAVPEPARNDALGHKEPPKNLHYLHDTNFPTTIAQFLDWCLVDSRAAFFLPGTVAPGGTGKADVLSLPAIVVDFDKGNPDENLVAVEQLLGPATIVVESGGRTELGPKLHAYWRLAEPATLSAIGVACAVREELARRFGGDPAFKQPAQVIRVPGSVHLKGSPALVKLRTVRDIRYALADIATKLSIGNIPARDNSNYFDFSAKENLPSGNLDRALTQPVHEGAVDEITRFDAAGQALGHFIRMVREGRYSLDEAWEAAKGWNQATLVPPWDETRLRNDFDRLNRIDHETHGPVVPPAVQTQAGGYELTDWYARRFKGSAPQRKWLVEGLVPAGVPGVFAAVGDAGKSMLALKLAHVVGNYPAAQSTADGPAGINDTPTFFGQPIVGRGTAVFLTGEDDEAEVHRRLEAIDPTGMRYADASRLIVLPLLAAGGARAIVTDGPAGPQTTPFWTDLKAKLLALPDLTLVILDPLAHFVGTDMNDNMAGAAIMSELNKLASETRATVLLVHHFNKGGKITGLSDARGAVLGAGAWVNHSRFAMVLWEASEDEAYGTLKALDRATGKTVPSGLVYFGGLTKSNAPASKQLRTLVRGEAGILEDVTDRLRRSAPSANDVDQALYRELLALREANPRLVFTPGATKLWSSYGPIVRKLGLPITREGKGKNSLGVVSVFERMLDKGLFVRQPDTTKDQFELMLPA